MPSPKPQLVPSSKEPTRESVIDEFGELDRQVKAFSPTAKRHELLRKQILAWYPDLPGDQAQPLSGVLYDARITERDNESHILSMPKLCKLLGREKFFAICKITIKALEEALGETAAALHLVKRRTGARHVVAVPKASPAAPAKAA